MLFRSTKLSIMEIKWGLVPDMAGTALMRELARGDVGSEERRVGKECRARGARDS